MCACSAGPAPLYHRGRKIGSHGFYLVSVIDVDGGFEFRVFDPRLGRLLAKRVAYDAAIGLASHSQSICSETSILVPHLAQRLEIAGDGTLQFAAGMLFITVD